MGLIQLIHHFHYETPIQMVKKSVDIADYY